jgi:hypothetical protein
MMLRYLSHEIQCVYRFFPVLVLNSDKYRLLHLGQLTRHVPHFIDFCAFILHLELSLIKAHKVLFQIIPLFVPSLDHTPRRN